MKELSAHMANINRVLKNIKLEVMANFICSDNKGVIITTNKVVSMLDLQTIERYIKNIKNIESNHVEALKLPQSKLYLKIIGISYLLEDSNTPISSNVIEKIIKENHIFNNIILASKPRLIKVSSKSNMFIIWINIWDIQSGVKTKSLINRCFNVESFIVTIQNTNMNPSVLQYKNY